MVPRRKLPEPLPSLSRRTREEARPEEEEGTSVAMSNHDDNVEVIFRWRLGGYCAFVHDPAHRGACLSSLFADYHWKPGPLQAKCCPRLQQFERLLCPQEFAGGHLPVWEGRRVDLCPHRALGSHGQR